MWVRGLKLCIKPFEISRLEVAPYVGAWIETLVKTPNLRLTGVAPYVGAWIETQSK